ncbi:MAG: hypothetical protein IT260_07560 [Saprospiraceae bacterium]|nr:hypothetical protein [Saprospiraceae bacterium]
MELSNPALAQLYTIPTAHWTAINRRVGVVLLMADIADTVVQDLPGFTELEAACHAWSASTFLDLVEHAHHLDAYAADAIALFQPLQEQLAALPAGPLPDPIRQEVSDALWQLQTATLPLTSGIALLSEEVATFMQLNQQVDARLMQYQEALQGWASLSQQTAAIDEASGLVNGAFQSLADNLTYVLHDIDITAPWLESLNIDLSIQTWANIQTEARAFASQADDQQKHWSDPLG